jgi:hypothetical protein
MKRCSAQSHRPGAMEEGQRQCMPEWAREEPAAPTLKVPWPMSTACGPTLQGQVSGAGAVRAGSVSCRGDQVFLVLVVPWEEG